MTKNFIIPLVVYPFDVMVSIGQEDWQVKKLLDKYNVKYEDNDAWRIDEDVCCKARTVRFESGQILIRLKQLDSCVEYGIMAHEVFHAVEFLFDRIYIKHSLECGEAWAYLIGYITQEIYKKL